MYQYYFHSCTPVNAHYFNIFRNFLMVVLSIPVYLRLHSLVMIDQSCPVYASAIDSRKHFLFFRETVKSSVDILSLGRKGMRPDFSIIQKVSHRHNWSKVCHMTGLLAGFTCKSQSMDRRTNYCKGRRRGGGRSRHADTRTSTWNYFQGLQCLFFNVLNSS